MVGVKCVLLVVLLLLLPVLLLLLLLPLLFLSCEKVLRSFCRTLPLGVGAVFAVLLLLLLVAVFVRLLATDGDAAFGCCTLLVCEASGHSDSEGLDIALVCCDCKGDPKHKRKRC